jgi:hypothetical protein
MWVGITYKKLPEKQKQKHVSPAFPCSLAMVWELKKKFPKNRSMEFFGMS